MANSPALVKYGRPVLDGNTFRLRFRREYEPFVHVVEFLRLVLWRNE